MFNSKKPDCSDLPSSKELLKSIGVALFIAAVLLVVAILPAMGKAQ